MNPSPDSSPADALFESESMRVLGRLVGGAAHDYNNLLAVICGNAGQLLLLPELSSEAREAVQRIQVAGERAAHLTRQLLLFSRQHPCNRSPLHFQTFWLESQAALQRLAGEKIQLQEIPCTTRAQIDADAMMLEQLLAVLVANARDAMPDGGVVQVQALLVELTFENVKQHPEGREGAFLCVTVEDSGVGISPDVLPHVFEPFFTTNDPSKRVGLGLAVAQGIAKLHEGWIEIESVKESGTKVSVYLPVLETDQAISPPVVLTDYRGQETILVVEDDDLLRETTTAILKAAGYRVLQAVDGSSAKETWHWHAERISLVMTDVVLPHDCSGLQLAEQMQQERPGLKVICTSGFSPEMMDRLGGLRPGMLYVPKPYHVTTLLHMFRTLLNASSE